MSLVLFNGAFTRTFRCSPPFLPFKKDVLNSLSCMWIFRICHCTKPRVYLRSLVVRLFLPCCLFTGPLMGLSVGSSLSSFRHPPNEYYLHLKQPLVWNPSLNQLNNTMAVKTYRVNFLILSTIQQIFLFNKLKFISQLLKIVLLIIYYPIARMWFYIYQDFWSIDLLHKRLNRISLKIVD